jgi:hypothetical protein
MVMSRYPRKTSAEAWRQLLETIARVYRLDVLADWLARQRLTIWLDAHMPTLPWPWWRVWLGIAYVYTAVIVALFVWAIVTGRLP